MRRGAGIGAIKNKSAVQAKFKDKGNELASDQLEEMSKQVEVFHKNLEEFASKHRDKIRKNPQFRFQFQQMCSAIGVDPLASSKGFWSKMLGVGDFYYELGIQIIEACMAASQRTGGFLDLDELYNILLVSRGKGKQEISKEDILMAIKSHKCLGSGFKAIALGEEGKYLIQSVPIELSMDATSLLVQAQKLGYVTVGQLQELLRWSEERAKRTLDSLILEGIAWLDEQANENQYWFPAFFKK